MFGQDPFNMFRHDPFFTSAFGPDPFSPMGGNVFNSAGPSQQQAQRGYQSRAPVIEEVNDEPTSNGNRSQPIVEEPDEDDPAAHRAQRQRRSSPPRSMSTGRVRHGGGQVQQQQYPGHGMFGPSLLSAFGGFGGFGGFGSLLQGMQNMASAPGATSYSYSSSSYQSSGPNGVTYQATHTQRAGPGGVRESQSTVRDGRTGEQSIRIARGLGEKERVMVRTRDGSGREVAKDDLKGISTTEVDHFDHEWRTHAERALPSFGAGRGGMGRMPGGRSSAAAPPAPLPAPMGSASAYSHGYDGHTGARGDAYSASAHGARVEPDYHAPHYNPTATGPGAGLTRAHSTSRTIPVHSSGYTGRY